MFTHDLIFVNDLYDLAVSANAKFKMVTPSPEPAGGRDRRGRAAMPHRLSAAISARLGSARLRTSRSAASFIGTDTILKPKHLGKVTVPDEADCVTFKIAFKRCSDLIEAHNPSRARDASVPFPNEIFRDIQTLKD